MNTKKIKITLLFCLLVIVSLIFLKDFKKISNKAVDINISQYSDKNDIGEISPEMQSLAVDALKNSKRCVLDLSISPNIKEVPRSKEISYIVSVSNISKLDCKNTSLSMYYSDKEEFLSSDLSPTASNYYWNFNNIASGEEKKIIITTKAVGSIKEVVSIEGCAASSKSKDSCASSSVVIVEESIKETPVVTTNKAQENGLWVWTSPIKMSEAYINSILEASSVNNINSIYVTVDDFLDIHSLPEGLDKENKKQDYFKSINLLVNFASKKNISVYAEAGWRDWAQPKQKYKAFAIVDFVLEYNLSYPDNKLYGLQYDVEPYLLSSYENNKSPILKNFVTLIDETKDKLKNSDLRFSVVIPHFYDSRQAWTPLIEYKGNSKSTFTHLLDILDTRDGSSIILMSYRNFAEGNNGVIQISEVEVNEASEGSHKTKIIIGQETGNVDPSYVTYYGLPKSEYLKQVEIIRKAFSNKSGFGGVSVHYLEPFLQLK